MPKYAVVNNLEVLNVIEAESLEIAESVTGFTCIEYTTEPAEPGGTYDGVSFIKKKPYPSWVLNSDKKWEAPVVKPEDTETHYYVWDEDNLTWEEVAVNE